MLVCFDSPRILRACEEATAANVFGVLHRAALAFLLPYTVMKQAMDEWGDDIDMTKPEEDIPDHCKSGKVRDGARDAPVNAAGFGVLTRSALADRCTHLWRVQRACSTST